MRLVKLTEMNSEKSIYVNVESIVTVFASVGGVWIEFIGNKEGLLVKESEDEVVSKLGGNVARTAPVWPPTGNTVERL